MIQIIGEWHKIASLCALHYKCVIVCVCVCLLCNWVATLVHRSSTIIATIVIPIIVVVIRQRQSLETLCLANDETD